MAGDDVGGDCCSESTPGVPCSSTSYGFLHPHMERRQLKEGRDKKKESAGRAEESCEDAVVGN